MEINYIENNMVNDILNSLMKEVISESYQKELVLSDKQSVYPFFKHLGTIQDVFSKIIDLNQKQLKKASENKKGLQLIHNNLTNAKNKINILLRYSMEIMNNEVSEELDNLRWEYNFERAKESDMLSSLFDEAMEEINHKKTKPLIFD